MDVNPCKYATNDDLTRLRSAREQARGQRCQLRCRRCHCLIPPGKRADAVYCSTKCKRAYRWEKLDLLRREIRLALRALKVREHCLCGAALDTTVRRGPVPQQCRRCYMRQARQRWRDRQRDSS